MAHVGLSGCRPTAADGAWGLVAATAISMSALVSTSVAEDAAEAVPQPRRSHIQPVGELATAERSHVDFGIQVSRPPDVVRKQLALDANAGLVVDSVAEQSRAAGVGLEQHDVLISVDGQTLIVPEQLMVLLAGTGAAAPRECTLIRRGARMTLPLVPGAAKPSLSPSSSSQPPAAAQATAAAPTTFAPQAASAQPATSAPEAARQLKPTASALAVLSARPPSAVAACTMTSGVVRQTADNTLVQNDPDYALMMSRTDEIRLVVRDARGRTLFNGAIETPEQRSRVPLAVRGRVEKLEHLLDNQVASRLPADTKEKTRPVAEIGRLDIVPIEVR